MLAAHDDGMHAPVEVETMASGKYYIPNPRGKDERGRTSSLKSALINSLAPGDRKKIIDEDANSPCDGLGRIRRAGSSNGPDQPYFNNSADPKTSKSRLLPCAQRLRGLKPRLDAIEN